MSEQENEDYAKEYSKQSFWAKLGKYAIVAGKQVVEKALILYYCLSDRETPKWAKGVIIAALGYFILPLDAIPDFVPGAGYADDLGVLAVAFAAVLVHIKPEHREQAKKKLRQWFG